MTTKTEKIIAVRDATLGEAVQTFLDLGLVATSRQTRAWYAKRLNLVRRALGDGKPLSDLLVLAFLLHAIIYFSCVFEDRINCHPPILLLFVC